MWGKKGDPTLGQTVMAKTINIADLQKTVETM